MEVFYFIQYRVSMAFLLAFLLLFLPLKRSFLRSTGLAAVCFVLTGILEGFCFFRFSYDSTVVVLTLLEIILVQAFAWGLCKYRDSRALFTGITSSVFVLPGNVMGIFTYMASQNCVSSTLVQMLIHAGLLIIFCVAVREDYLEEMATRERNWSCLCIIPALYYAAIASLITWPQSIYDAPDSVLGIICILLLMASTYSVMIKSFAKQRQESIMNRNVQFLENYTKRLRHEKEVLRENEYQTAVLRHDMRHVASLIATYLEEDDKEKIAQVLHELNEKLETTHRRVYCDNAAIDGTITECAALAEKRQVDYRIEVSIGEKLPLNELEYVTVLSNLLENAVMAAGEVEDAGNRFVHLKLKRIKNQQLLEIVNSYAGEIIFSRKTGLPLSAKGIGHGYGMGSVQAYAQKYGAVFDCSAREGIFSVRFLVNMESTIIDK